MQPLPYRTDAEHLHRFVAWRSRGRASAEIRTAEFSTKSFEGTAAAVEALGLMTDRDGDLTALGRRYALSSGAERAGVVREMLAAYPPYARLLEAARAAAPRPATLAWIESWWASHGCGSSGSNRSEAAPVLAKLADAAGLGRYVQGRRGRSSRIEWSVAGPAASVPTAPPADPGPAGGRARSEPGLAAAISGADVLSWELTPGRELSVHVPRRLTTAERTRVRNLLALLLSD